MKNITIDGKLDPLFSDDRDARIEKLDEKVRVPSYGGNNLYRPIDGTYHISHAMQELDLAGSRKFDIATLLKHKNVSPHALYLIYRTLFYDLTKPRRTAPVLSLVR